MGGFNAELLSNFRSGFCESYNLNLLKPNLIEESACFKNPGNSTCIDLILTNRHKIFQNSTIIEKGLSYFLLPYSSYFKKLEPKNLYIVIIRTFLSHSFEQNLLRG